MCSYPESRFGQCVISDLRFGRSLLSLGGTWPAPCRCRTHALLAAPRPPKNWQSRRLLACLPVAHYSVHISMRDYLFRPCTPHNGMWHKWFVVIIISADRVRYRTRRTLLSTQLYDTTRRSRHHHYTVVEPSVSTIMHFYKLSEKLLPLTQQIKRPLLHW